MPSSSKWMLAAEGVQSLVGTALAALTGGNAISTSNVKIRRTPWKTQDITAPGVLIVPVPETNAKVTNKRDDVGHGVGVIIFAVNNRDQSTNHDRLHLWRETAETAVRNKRISAANVHMIDIEPRTVVDEAAFSNQFDATSFVARCYVRTL